MKVIKMTVWSRVRQGIVSGLAHCGTPVRAAVGHMTWRREESTSDFHRGGLRHATGHRSWLYEMMCKVQCVVYEICRIVEEIEI